MRWPPWLLVLILGLLAAVSWFAFSPSSDDLRLIEVETPAAQNETSRTEVETDAAPAGDREASVPEVESISESTDPQPMLRFRVRDAETEQPIVGARLSHSQGLSPVEVSALTDGDGRCEFASENLATGHGYSFLVFAAGYQITTHFIPGLLPPTDEVIIELNRAGTLHGVVRMPNGSAAPKGTWVVAWIGPTPEPEDFSAIPLAYAQSGPLRDFEMRLAEESRVVTRTDAHGEFRFTDLAATTEYQLIAACEGMLSQSLRSVLPETSGPLELKLLYAWGICLDARDSQGSRLPGNGLVYLDRGRASWSFPDGRRPMLGGTYAALPLAGLQTEYSETLVSTQSTDQFGFVELSESEVPPSIRVSVQPPGFARLQSDFTFRALDSTFRSTELRFDRTAIQFGSLDVDVLQSPLDESNRGERNQSMVIAKLYPLGFPESGRNEVLSFALVHPQDGLHHFSGIPAGEYWIGFESANRLLKVHWETQRIVIDSGTAKARLELGSVGALHLNVLAQEGSQLPRPRTWIRIMSLSDNPRVYGQIMLKPGTNQISLIPNGDYELALVRETERSHTLVPDVPIQFSITAGETHAAEIVLAELDRE